MDIEAEAKKVMDDWSDKVLSGKDNLGIKGEMTAFGRKCFESGRNSVSVDTPIGQIAYEQGKSDMREQAAKVAQKHFCRYPDFRKYGVDIAQAIRRLK